MPDLFVVVWACAVVGMVLYGTHKTKYELRRRTLVVLFDGTGEDRLYTHRPATNIGRIADQIRKRRDPSVVIMYHRGVGTSEEHGLPFSKMPGLLGGKGISQVVQDVYLSVVDNYRPGDSLFLLGYSRGAAAAWELASILDQYGVPRNPYTARVLARSAFKKLRKTKKGLLHVQDPLVKDRVPVTIRVLGLFDCVVATGALLHLHRLPPSIGAVYHAVAIDERRRHFSPTLLPPGALEAWFTGGHSNVGGGSGAGCTLSDITLQWMLENLARHGLAAEPLTANMEAAEKEIDQAWNNFLVRLSGEMKPRAIPTGALVHETVLRLISNTTYRPRNLPASFRALLRGNRQRYRWCNTTRVGQGDYEVSCGEPRPLRLPPIGEDRRVVPQPQEQPITEQERREAAAADAPPAAGPPAKSPAPRVSTPTPVPTPRKFRFFPRWG